MLVQFTPIAQLPADVAARLRQQLTALPLRQSNDPMLFEGYHLSATDVTSFQRLVKTAATKPLFG
jgi:hypothetical protein